MFTLPVNMGGLGIPNPSTSANLNFETSKKCSTILSDAIVNNIQLNMTEHMKIMKETKKIAVEKKKEKDEIVLNNTIHKFIPAKRRAVERSITKISQTKTSNWLSVLPIRKDHFDLSANEFRDALAIRYNREPPAMPNSCDGCGDKQFSLQHALDCKAGGLITRRHNEIRDLMGELCDKAWGNCVKEPIISEVPPGLRGDLAVRGTWEALFDIRVIDTDAPSYASRSVKSVISGAEEEKKRKYNTACEARHATFTPLVTSVDGVLGEQFQSFVNVLSERLAERWRRPIMAVLGWLRARIGVAVVRAARSVLSPDSTTVPDLLTKSYQGSVLSPDSTTVPDLLTKSYQGSVLSPDSTTVPDLPTLSYQGSVLSPDSTTVPDLLTKSYQGSVLSPDSTTVPDLPTLSYQGSVLSPDSTTVPDLPTLSYQGSVLSPDSTTVPDLPTLSYQGSVLSPDSTTVPDLLTLSYQGSVLSPDSTTVPDLLTLSLKKARKALFKDVNLAQFDYTKVNLAQFDYTKVNLAQFDYTKVNLAQFDYTNVNLVQFDYSKVNLAQFEYTKVNLAQFDYTKVNLAQFDYPKVNLAQFFGSELWMNSTDNWREKRELPSLLPLHDTSPRYIFHLSDDNSNMVCSSCNICLFTCLVSTPTGG
ncbi:hypothetical protein WDU94_013856 [Cyamophila willieti]